MDRRSLYLSNRIKFEKKRKLIFKNFLKLDKVVKDKKTESKRGDTSSSYQCGKHPEGPDTTSSGVEVSWPQGRANQLQELPQGPGPSLQGSRRGES